MKYWYYVEDGKQVGPVSEQELVNLLQSGKLNSNTLIWTQKLTAWLRACDVENLAPSCFTPPPIPIAPPIPVVRADLKQPQSPPPLPPIPQKTGAVTNVSGFFPRPSSYWPAMLVAWSTFQVVKRIEPAVASNIFIAVVVGMIVGALAILPFELIYRRQWPMPARHALAWGIAVIYFILAATA